MSECCVDLFDAYKRRCNCFNSLINTSNLEKRISSGETILNYVCWNGREIERIKLLLKHKSDVNTKCNNCFTPLMGIATYGNMECLKLLLENNAYINAKNYYNNTVLIFAIRCNKYDNVKLLLENNADFSIVNSHGYTALDYAKRYNNQEIIKLLEQHIYINTYNTMITIFDESSTGMLYDLAELTMKYLLI